MAKPLTPISHRGITLTDWAGAAGAYAAMTALRILPFSFASALGGALASALGPMLKKSAVARKNLKLAFPQKSEAEIEVILREVWETLGRTAFEFPLMGRLLKASGARRIEIEGREHLDAALDIARTTGRPVLFFGAHLGNWEIPPVAAATLGFRVNSFYRAPNNALLLKLFTQRKTAGEMIPKGAAGARRAFSLLKKGEHLGLLVDQKLNDGIKIPFFGRDAMTGTALAEFALRFDAPAVPIRCVRLPGARFKLVFYPPLEIEKSDVHKEDVERIMRTVNTLVEGWIRETPGQWLWLHQRWPD